MEQKEPKVLTHEEMLEIAEQREKENEQIIEENEKETRND
jgi:hypothetical protein